jgi:polyisoprenyl-teichoic acid--peptidoglycan teichoic acid transferase
MSYFRQHNKPKSQRQSIDGFVSADSKRNVTSRFRSTYQPRAVDSQDFIGHKDSDKIGFIRDNRTRNVFDDNQGRKPTQFSSDLNSGQKKHRKKLGFSHKKFKQHRYPKLRTVAKSFGVLMIAMVVGVSSLFAYGYIKARNIFRGDGEGAAALQRDVDPARLNGEGDGRVNILLLGKGGEGETAPDLTDTLLVASIDPVANEAALVSVPRDLWVRDANGSSMKINAIYATAKANALRGDDSPQQLQAAEDKGLAAIKNAVSEVLGIPVHYYGMIDFQAFKEAIDTVGGITVDVKEPLYDQSVAWLLNGNPLVADEGLQTFDGHRALLYARSRMGSARGDFDRTERQREILIALQKKILSIGTFSNPFKVVELMNTFGGRVRTDLNGLEEIKRLYEIAQQINANDVVSIGLADPPNILVRTDMIGNQSVVVPSAGLYQYQDIHSYIRNTVRDPFLKKENARILILNGTSTPGLATATSELLKSYGYNVIGVDNAPTTDYVQNQLIDLTNGSLRYTKSYLERRMTLQSAPSEREGLPTIEQADFVIILGTDEVDKTFN